jgi:multiple sugar transport system permease protein
MIATGEHSFPVAIERTHHPTEKGVCKMSSRSFGRRREAIEGLVFISPWLIGFLLFTAGPIIASLLISFTKWSLIGAPEFAGLENFQYMMGDKFFWQALKVTLKYLVNVPLNLALGLLLAILLNQKIRALWLFRTIYYLPSVTAGVAVSLLWVWVFNPRFGLLNTMLAKVGIKGPAWLYDEHWVIPSLIIISIWGVGRSMLIYLGGLQGIPTSLYEAATIDGAGAWHRFRYVTIPMLSPVILFNLIMGIIGSFQVFDSVYVMTGGGPNYASLFYVLYLYQQAFQWFNMGYASALAWVLFLIILVCTALIFKSSASWVYYEGGGVR